MRGNKQKAEDKSPKEQEVRGDTRKAQTNQNTAKAEPVSSEYIQKPSHTPSHETTAEMQYEHCQTADERLKRQTKPWRGDT